MDSPYTHFRIHPEQVIHHPSHAGVNLSHSGATLDYEIEEEEHFYFPRQQQHPFLQRHQHEDICGENRQLSQNLDETSPHRSQEFISLGSPPIGKNMQQQHYCTPGSRVSQDRCHDHGRASMGEGILEEIGQDDLPACAYASMTGNGSGGPSGRTAGVTAGHHFAMTGWCF